jgi:hypothetical protein
MEPEPAELANICSACGARHRAEARFCRACGAKLGVEPEPAAIIEPSSTPTPTPTPTPTKSGRFGAINPIVLGAAVVVMLAIGVSAYFLMAKNAGPAANRQQYVTRLVRVRTSTEVAASSVLGDLRRGEAITGSWVTAADGHTRWLRIKWATGAPGFVWGANLSPNAPPALATTLNADTVLDANTSIFPQPVPGTALVVLPAGTKVRAVGVTSTGWREIELSEGGVGYIAPVASGR